MSNYEVDKTVPVEEEKPRGNSVMIGVLAAGLVIALAGDGYLIMKANNLNDQITQMQSATQAQLSKLGDSTTAMLERRLEAVSTDLQDAHDTANSAVKQARAEVQRRERPTHSQDRRTAAAGRRAVGGVEGRHHHGELQVG